MEAITETQANAIIAAKIAAIKAPMFAEFEKLTNEQLDDKLDELRDEYQKINSVFWLFDPCQTPEQDARRWKMDLLRMKIKVINEIFKTRN